MALSCRYQHSVVSVTTHALEAGGTLQNAQGAMAAHVRMRARVPRSFTTAPGDEITLDEVERIELT